MQRFLHTLQDWSSCRHLRTATGTIQGWNMQWKIAAIMDEWHLNWVNEMQYCTIQECGGITLHLPFLDCLHEPRSCTVWSRRYCNEANVISIPQIVRQSASQSHIALRHYTTFAVRMLHYSRRYSTVQLWWFRVCQEWVTRKGCNIKI